MGARYVEVTISIVLRDNLVNGQFVERQTVRNLRLITAGGENNAVAFNVTYHLTINANGEVAIEFEYAGPEACVRWLRGAPIGMALERKGLQLQAFSRIAGANFEPATSGL